MLFLPSEFLPLLLFCVKLVRERCPQSGKKSLSSDLPACSNFSDARAPVCLLVRRQYRVTVNNDYRRQRRFLRKFLSPGYNEIHLHSGSPIRSFARFSCFSTEAPILQLDGMAGTVALATRQLAWHNVQNRALDKGCTGESLVTKFPFITTSRY